MAASIRNGTIELSFRYIFHGNCPRCISTNRFCALSLNAQTLHCNDTDLWQEHSHTHYFEDFQQENQYSPAHYLEHFHQILQMQNQNLAMILLLF